MLARSALAVCMLSFGACGDDSPPAPGNDPPVLEAGVDARTDASQMVDAGDERETGIDVSNEANADIPLRLDIRGDSIDDLAIDGPSDADGPKLDAPESEDSRADTAEAIVPDGGPVTGPGCGGCFADELQAGGRCITNTSCGSPPHTVMRSANGVCQIDSCHPGWGNCDGRADNGCEADLSQPYSCNGCNTMCPADYLCAPSGCVAQCSPPLVTCGGTCVDISTSPLHCGACFEPCIDQRWNRPTCVAGVCGHEMICGAGSVPCNGACIILSEDPANCGSCGRACPSPAGGTVSCRSGVCIPHCPAGLTLCGNSCVDPQTDAANCGKCGNACETGGCVGGACNAAWSAVIATGTSPTALAVDDTSLYWIERGTGRIMKVAKGGGTPAPLATGQAPFDLALDTTNVYWSSPSNHAIRRIAKAGGTSPELVLTANRPTYIATDGTTVYFEEPLPTADGGNAGDAAPPEDAGLPPPPVMRKTKIGSGVAEDFFQFPNGDTDATATRILVDATYVYWAGRKRTAPGTTFTFVVEKDTANVIRALPAIWGELAMDEAFVYVTTGSGSTGSPLTVGAFEKATGRGRGIMQFDPGASYPEGASMTAGTTYVYRSSPGALTGVQKVLKCGTQNEPVKIVPDQWSSLIIDAIYIYGVVGNEIRRTPR